MIDYPHDESGSIVAPGIPDDIAFLGKRFDTLAETFRKIVDIMSETAKQPVMIPFNILANTPTSPIVQTTIRARINWIVIPTEPVSHTVFNVGNGVMLAGLGPLSGAGVYPVSFVLEPGRDYQFSAQGLGNISINPVTFWLLGTLDQEGE